MTSYGEVLDEGSLREHRRRARKIQRASRRQADDKRRRWLIRIALFLLLLLVIFAVRFIPDSWNPFAPGIQQAQQAAEQGPGGSAGGGSGGSSGATSTSQTQQPTSPQDVTRTIVVQGQNGEKGPQGDKGPTGDEGSPGPPGSGVSLGEGAGEVATCDAVVNVSLRSTWVAGEFRVAAVRVYNVDAACAGQTLYLDLLDGSDTYLASLTVPTLSLSSGEVTLTAAAYPSLSEVRSQSVARVLIEITSM